MFVTQAYPPVAGSHVTRAVAIANALTEVAPTTVVTIRVGKGYPQRSEVANMPKASVIRTSPGLVHELAHGASAVSSGSGNSTRRSRVRSKIMSYVKKAAISSYRRVTVIDAYFDWIPPLRQELRNRISETDVIVSTSMPNSAHVGVLLALRGRRNQWIADFGDPWTLDRSAPRRAPRRWIEGMFEKAVVGRADHLLFTTEATKADYAKAYPRASDRMNVMRMGFDPADDAIPAATLPGVTVFYGGSLPANNRSASEFLNVAARRKDITFIFAGACVAEVRSAFVASGVPRNVECIDWLSHPDFVGYVRGASVSVVVGNSNPQQIPGKVYQYSAFAPRILYIRGMPQGADEGAALLSGAIVSCENREEDIDRALSTVLELPPASLPRDARLAWPEVVSPLSTAISEFDG